MRGIINYYWSIFLLFNPLLLLPIVDHALDWLLFMTLRTLPWLVNSLTDYVLRPYVFVCVMGSKHETTTADRFWLVMPIAQWMRWATSESNLTISLLLTYYDLTFLYVSWALLITDWLHDMQQICFLRLHPKALWAPNWTQPTAGIHSLVIFQDRLK